MIRNIKELLKKYPVHLSIVGIIGSFIADYLEVPWVEKYAIYIYIVLIILLAIILCIKKKYKIAFITFLVGLIAIPLLQIKNIGKQDVDIASGNYIVNMESIALYSHKSDDYSNNPQLICEFAELKNLSTDYIYKSYQIKDNKIVFENVNSGQYKITVKLRGYELYEEQVSVMVKEMNSDNTIVQKNTIIKYVKYNDPVWGEWGQWSKWSTEKITSTSWREVEMKYTGTIEKKAIAQYKYSFKDPKKPIYEKRQVLVGTRGNEKIYGTIDAIVDYETISVNSTIFSYPEEEGKMLYRYRLRNLIEGEQEVLYSDYESKDILYSLGYEIEDTELYR